MTAEKKPGNSSAPGEEEFRDVRKYYDTHVTEEDERLEENVFELPVTFKFLDKYLKPGARVLDMACGTGKYAAELIERDVKVGLNDLSEKNMEMARARLGAHPNIIHSEVSNAVNSGLWEKEEWDAILLLGPLYHMTNRKNRLAILEKARHAVSRDGYIFTAFMSRTAALLNGLKNNPSGILKQRGALQLWQTGTDDEFIEATPWFVNAHFAFPEEVESLVREAWLEPVHLAGIEGIFGERMDLYHKLDPELKHAWMEFVKDQCEEEHMVQASKHLLSVCRPGPVPRVKRTDSSDP